MHESIVHPASLDQIHAASRNSIMMDEFSYEDEDFQIAESVQEACQTKNGNDITRAGNLRCDDRDNAHGCWQISDGNNFRVHSKQFCYDKTKIPAGKHLVDLVAVDWFKDTENRPCCYASRLCCPSCFRKRAFRSGDKYSSSWFNALLFGILFCDKGISTWILLATVC